MIDLIMGYECNVRCDYCSIFEEQRSRNMTTAQILAELRRAWGAGMRKVAFGGGEPTIRKDLLPLVRWCKDRGFHHVKVASNGMMYSYEQYVADAISAGVTQFNISAMAHTDELYERIMGKPGSLAVVTKGVDNLVAAGKPPVLDLIIKRETYAHLSDIVAFWAGLGVQRFALWLVSLTDRNAAFPESMPRIAEMRDHIVAAFEKGRELGVEVISRHIPRCMLPGYEAHVYDLREDRVLVVTPGSRFFLWESVISPNTYVAKCEGCVFYRGACLGARRDYVERYGEDEIVPIRLPAVTAG
jgi:cyclic pyranopterin phosphate synthase